MAGLKITRFGGLLPKSHEQDLHQAMAQVCIDVDLSRGILQSFRTDKKVSDLSGKSLFVRGCCVIIDDEPCATFAYMPYDCGYVVKANQAGVFVSSDCESWCDLGLLYDLPKPNIQVLGKVRDDFNRELRQYFYTVVNDFDWESMPSAVSDVVVADNDVDVIISGLPFEHSGCLKSVRVYCAVSGLDYGTEKEQKEAEFLLVGEIHLGKGAMLHKAHAEYGDLCISDEFAPPPAGLHSIAYAENGQLGGLCGGELCLSEPFLPHAWNEKYRYGDFPAHPVRFVVSGGLGYVLTNGQPAVIDLSQPPTETGCRDVQVLNEHLPIVSYQSAAVFSGGVVYASRDGLALLAGNQARIIGLDYWTSEQWALMQPQTLRGIVHNGWYFGSTDTETFRFKLPENIHDKVDIESLGNLSIRADSWCRDRDKLFFVNNLGVYEWAAGKDFKEFVWRGKLNVSAGYVSWTAYKVVSDFKPVHVRHFLSKRYDGKLFEDSVVIGDKIVHDSKPNRLKSGYSGLAVAVELRSCGVVSQYCIAPSVADLGSV